MPLVTQRYQLKQFKYNSHYWLLSLIARKKGPLHILDVGTADGYLGAILKQQGHSLVGVEKDCAVAERARPHYEIIHSADIEQFDFPYREQFDVVLFADVLEHLRRPEEILRRCFACQKPTWTDHRIGAECREYRHSHELVIWQVRICRAGILSNTLAVLHLRHPPADDRGVRLSNSRDQPHTRANAVGLARHQQQIVRAATRASLSLHARMADFNGLSVRCYRSAGLAELV